MLITGAKKITQKNLKVDDIISDEKDYKSKGAIIAKVVSIKSDMQVQAESIPNFKGIHFSIRGQQTKWWIKPEYLNHWYKINEKPKTK